MGSFLEPGLKIRLARIAPIPEREARVELELPKGAFGTFRKMAKGECYTRLCPSLSDSITGTTLSLAWKDYDSPVFVFHNSDADLAGRLAYSSLPEHTVRLLTEKDFRRLHPFTYELA